MSHLKDKQPIKKVTLFFLELLMYKQRHNLNVYRPYAVKEGVGDFGEISDSLRLGHITHYSAPSQNILRQSTC